jgi:3',5'-cyclic AMP phosphodiesterase CpdA
MTITNTWAVQQMDCYPEEDGETDVVFTVHWTLTGTDGTYTGYVYGTQSVSIDPDVPFTPYADLTETQVIGWVKSAMGEEQVASYEANVAEQIADQIDPPVVTPPLPWSA